MRRRSLAKMSTGTFVVAVSVAVGAGVLRDPPLTTVTVNDATVHLSSRTPTVDDALRVAGVRVRDGRLLSAVRHRVLDAHADPGIVKRDGVAVTRDARVRTGDRVITIDGHDRDEPLVTRRDPARGTGLPTVERKVWVAPADGVDELLVGARSGEVVARRNLVPAQPAAPLPGNVLALTFDDGPSPKWTPILLQILRDEQVKATFCLVGYLAERYPDLVRAIAADGHVLCDHTEHHVEHLDRHPPDEIAAEIEDGRDTIARVAGRAPLFYRAPGGTLSPAVIDQAHRDGLRVLGWSIDTRDYLEPPAPVILDRIISAVRPGSVVLLHDGGGDRRNTVSMVQELIHRLRFFGWTFVTPS